jgi:hypothetical protein
MTQCRIPEDLNFSYAVVRTCRLTLLALPLLCVMSRDSCITIVGSSLDHRTAIQAVENSSGQRRSGTILVVEQNCPVTTLQLAISQCCPQADKARHRYVEHQPVTTLQLAISQCCPQTDKARHRYVEHQPVTTLQLAISQCCPQTDKARHRYVEHQILVGLWFNTKNITEDISVTIPRTSLVRSSLNNTNYVEQAFILRRKTERQ